MSTRTTLRLLLAAGLLLLAQGALAAESTRGGNIAIGTHEMTLDSAYGDTTYSGNQINVQHAFNDHFGLRWGFYSAEHDDNSDVSVSGQSLQVQGGLGMASGFKLAFGVGVFSEEIAAGGSTESYSGTEFSYTIGATLNRLTLELMLATRDEAEYNDSLTSVSTTTFSVGYRF